MLTAVLAGDVLNFFITLCAWLSNSAFEIIDGGKMRPTGSRLLHAGANHAARATRIGADRVAEMTMFPETARPPRDMEPMRGLKVPWVRGLKLAAVIGAAGNSELSQTVAAVGQEPHCGSFATPIGRAGDTALTR